MGIQISGLLSGQAFDWKSIVDQLVAADGIPITGLQNQQTTNTNKISALTDIMTSLQDLQDAAQAIRSDNPFQNRTVATDNANSTWSATSTAGAPVGNYTFQVQTLATTTKVQGGNHIGQDLNATSSDFSALTIADMPTATAVTGADLTKLTFTVNGHQITFASTDTLKSVLDQIQTATGNDVTWSYANDKLTLTSASGGPVVLGATNDSSNFLQVMKLSSTSGASTTSSGTLGTASTTATLASGRLGASITAVDGSGNGSFTINGVSISYNVNTDTLGGVLSRINSSTAGVTATYDSSNDRVVLTNTSTGFKGLSVSEASGGLMDALNLTTTVSTPATTTYGTDNKFSLDGGATWLYSSSNTLGSSVHGISGLSVVVNSTGTETLTVTADTNSMRTSVQNLLDKFNAVQDLIDQDTKISSSAGSVSTSILSGNHEVEAWATSLQNLMFKTVTGITGSINHLDDLGIDFDGTTGHLVVKDSGKLNDALLNKSTDVQSYILDGTNGLVPTLYESLTNLKSEDSTQQNNLSQANQDLADQISTMQTRLDNERETLTNAFIAMLDAQSSAQSQNSAITNAFFKNNSNG